MATSKNLFWAASDLVWARAAARKTVNIVKYARLFATCRTKTIFAFALKAISRGHLI